MAQRGHPGQSREVASILNLQRTAGNRAVGQILQPDHGWQDAADASRGQPLDHLTRRAMEGRFGQDFSRVRIHCDAVAGNAMSRLGARARTIGEEIAFAEGRYRPASEEGQSLLAHELTHVIQQRLGGAAPVRQRAAPAEREANRVAEAMSSGAPLPAVTHGTAVGAAFQPDDQGMTAAHAGGAMGEVDAAFVLGQRGFHVIIGPAGPAGHQLTAPGLDMVAYNPQSDETWVLDNKASGGTSTVQSASAITRNLGQNLRTAIAQIRTMPPFQHQARVVQQLQDALDAVTQGNPLPAKVRLKITGAGGYHSGVSRKLQREIARITGRPAQDPAWEDLTGQAVRDARRQDIARARLQGVRTGRPVTHATGSGNAPGTAPGTSDGTAVVRIPVAAVSDVDEPTGVRRGAVTSRPVTARGGSSGGNLRAGAGAGAASVATGIATIIINQKLQEHYADYRAEGVRLYVDEALEKAHPQFEKVIQQNRTEIEKAQADGRHVYLHVVTKVRMVDSTDRDSGIGIGDVAYGSEVVRIQVVYEGDPEPKAYDPDTWLIGDLARGMLGFSSDYRTSRHPIEGTNLAVRRRKEVVRDVEGMMTDPVRPFEFETLLVKSHVGGVSRELLREYAGYKRELSAASAFSRDRQAAAYWGRMEALADAPIAEVITQAKVALVPLDELRQFAIEQRALEQQGGNADGVARWTDVLHLIDAPLDERLHAERQRSVWKRGPSATEVQTQRDTVATLERRRSELEQQLSTLAQSDARTQMEREAGEPPHPPWAKIAEIKKQIAALREEIVVEKRLLQGMKKP